MNKPFDSSHGKIILAVREFGRTRRIVLDAQERWRLGRATPENRPDIPLKSQIAGRAHGEFLLIDGQLFYVDKGSTNGTFLNGKKIAAGLKGRANPVLLNDGDALQIDGDLEAPDPESVRIEIEMRNR